jgi:lipid II:glycine glycyltransferase (peptidoglycan interpeptide bridge formation enzyme)
MDRFPQNIKLYVTKNSDNKVIAGTLLFITDMVIHSQYIASSDEGREKGALDMLFNYLIKENNGTHKYFDFGISSIEGGNILNEGLIFQKEGFGGRGVCYDKYEIKI